MKYNVLTRFHLPRAFSTVVADNQYAALGLMLLGTLARIAKIMGLESLPSPPAAPEGTSAARQDTKSVAQTPDPDLDLGVVVSRAELSYRGGQVATTPPEAAEMNVSVGVGIDETASITTTDM